MNTIFVVIWLAFIVFGVISNIRKSIKKAANPSPAKPRAVQVVRQAQTSAHTKTIASVQTVASEPVAPIRPTVVPKAVPVEAKPVVARVKPVAVVPREGIFSNQGSVMRAIIAQQVLGPPLALAEQSIWNQR